MKHKDYFYFKTLKYDLINKFNYNKIKEIPKFKKIILNISCKTTDIKIITSSLLALELISNQKGKITKTKTPNIFLKIKKGNPAGCKVTLRKHRMLNFFKKTIITIFPKLKNFEGFSLSKKITKDIYSYKIQDNFSFNELEKQYYLFNQISKINITIVTDSKIKNEMTFLLKSIQFPLII